MKLIGARPSAFNGSDGRIVEGYNLYLIYDPEETSEGVVGEQCERLFVLKSRLLFDPCSCVGARIDVRFNRSGKVQRVDLLEV